MYEVHPKCQVEVKWPIMIPHAMIIPPLHSGKLRLSKVKQVTGSRLQYVVQAGIKPRSDARASQGHCEPRPH